MDETKITASHELLLIGGSAGSLDVLLKVLPHLQLSLALAIVVVVHRKNSSDSVLSDLFGTRTHLQVSEIEDKQPIKPGHIYLAPPDYHLLFERDKRLALDYSEKINYSRPSIDVAFDSASEVYGPRLACLLLSGGNADGVAGLKLVRERGGLVAVQDPATAQAPFMPEQAILQVKIDRVLQPEQIADFINRL